MSKRKPVFDQMLDDVRIRVYARRSEYEVIFNNDDIDDYSAEVLVYPKIGVPALWAKQGLLEKEK